VADAEGLALERAVAVGNLRTALAQFLVERAEIEARIGDVGDGGRQVALVSVQAEAGTAPCAAVVGHGEVARVAVFQPFLKHAVHLLVECVDQADSRGGRGVELGRELLVVEEVEVVAAVRDGGRPLERTFAHCADGEPGRQGKALLHAREADVQSPAVEIDGRSGHAAHGIDHDDDVGVFLAHEAGRIREGPEDARGSLVVGQAEGVEAALRQGRVDQFRCDGLARFDLDSLGLHTAALRNLPPAPGEFPVKGVEHLLADGIADRAFHDASGRGTEEKDPALGV